MDIVIPSLGDIDQVEVIELCIAPGASVAEGDTLIVIESDKASMDVPATCDGVLQDYKVQLGELVSEGVVIATLSTAAGVADLVADDESAIAAEMTNEPVTETKSAVTEPQVAEAVSKIDILVPDLGDIEEVEVIEVAVVAGDQINFDSVLVVLESDKASMEVPAEQKGTVISVGVAVGDRVGAGTLIATAEVSSAEMSPVAEIIPEPIQKTALPTTQLAAAEAPPERASAMTDRTNNTGDATVYAGPAVRRLARELGVALDQVQGSGQRGRITKDDLKSHVKQQMNAPAAQSSGTGVPAIPAVDFARFGPVAEQSLTRMQQQVAANMQRSWLNVPHVTQHDLADITDMEEFRQSLKAEAGQRGVKLTPLAFIVRAVCHALAQKPKFNSSLHPDGQHLIVKEYINVGIATNTAEGLLVPVIRGADRKGLWELSENIAELAEKARDKKLALDDLGGGTFTVSSLGSIGGTGFTPIVNAPEVAILGVGRLTTQPQWNGEEFLPRQMLPLSLSYDHRVINGVDGGEFMQLLSQLLSDVRRLAL
jgi:pyruvate dehydrogenase E2 component (dihydrolipoamide acetyltransferase)